MMKCRILVGSACVLAALVALSPFEFYTYTMFTCSRCRIVKKDYRLVSSSDTKFLSNEYSAWYNQTQPDLAHVWCWWGTHRGYSLAGGSRACGTQHPVWQLLRPVQKRFLENASVNEIREFYALLDSDDDEERQRAVAIASQRYEEREFK